MRQGIATVLAVALALGAGAAAADSIEGWWKSPFPAPERGKVLWMEVEPWGKGWAGTLRHLSASTDPNRWIDPLDRHGAEPGDLLPVFARISGTDDGPYRATFWTGSRWADTTLRLAKGQLHFDGCSTPEPVCAPHAWSR